VIQASRRCERCRRPLDGPGGTNCVHVRVTEPDFNQALRGLIALIKTPRK
jgi:hypothetical protein